MFGAAETQILAVCTYVDDSKGCRDLYSHIHCDSKQPRKFVELYLAGSPVFAGVTSSVVGGVGGLRPLG